MKKKTLIARLFAFTLASVLAFSACSFLPEKPAEEPVKEEEEEEELQEIELSEKKVTIEIGETVEVEIENYDDLKKVKIEVEDEDIAEAEIDDEIITITGLAEGKTTLTVTAKDSEEVSLTIKVTAPEIVIPEITLEPGMYTASILLPDSFWEQSMGDEAEIFINFFTGKNFPIDFNMTIGSDGTAILAYDPDQFLAEFIQYVDDNYIEFMKLVIEYEGETWSDAYENILIANKEELIEELSATLDDTLEDMRRDTIEFTYEIVDGNVVFKLDAYNEKSTEILEDGSFILSFTAREIGGTMFGNYLDLHFYKK